MPLSPARIERLVQVAHAADQASHGNKGAVYAAACADLGCSAAQLHRWLGKVSVKPQRKQRSDAGAHGLTRDDAALLSAYMMEGYRLNDKKIQSLGLALKRARANCPRFAEAVDGKTGEVVALGEHAVARALRAYALHPTQLRRPTPAQHQRSLHPNDVWQIDASISTLFYVPAGSALAETDRAEFYKNKPEVVERIKPFLLTRFCITDHTSGAIFVHYVAGGESIVNMAESFLACLQPRPGQQLHGVPFHLMMDPGSAGTAGAFQNLLRRLQVRPLVNKRRNPRAKGQVENAHNLVETDFESGFRYVDVPSLAWINATAAKWMAYYNGQCIHSRHKTTRYAKWSEIKPDQLRLVDADVARLLLTHAPETPKVTNFMEVRFAGRVWSVNGIPGVMVGEKVSITHNPFNRDVAYLVQCDPAGQEELIEVPAAVQGEHGFHVDAPLIGREYKGMPDTLADTNRKAVERLVMGAATDEAAAAARKVKALPFGGQIDPYKHMADAPAPGYLRKTGAPLVPAVRVPAAAPAPEQVFTLFEAAAQLVRRGVAMTPERNAQVAAWHPTGVPESALDELVHRLSVRATLRVVGGGSLAND